MIQVQVIRIEAIGQLWIVWEDGSMSWVDNNKFHHANYTTKQLLSSSFSTSLYVEVPEELYGPKVRDKTKCRMPI